MRTALAGFAAFALSPLLAGFAPPQQGNSMMCQGCYFTMTWDFVHADPRYDIDLTMGSTHPDGRCPVRTWGYDDCLPTPSNYCNPEISATYSIDSTGTTRSMEWDNGSFGPLFPGEEETHLVIDWVPCGVDSSHVATLGPTVAVAFVECTSCDWVDTSEF